LRHVGAVIVLNATAAFGVAFAHPPFGNLRAVPTGVAAFAAAGQHGESETNSLGPSDPARGKAIFEKRCTGCHAMDVDHEGPRLAGVFGRKAGTVPGFDYSNGLKKSGVTWDEVTLKRWLTNPDLMVPDTTMDFLIPKAKERADVIAYLQLTSP
jgi:cytochrome c